MAKVLVLNVVGLTPRLLAHAPRLSSLGPPAPLTPPLPAVTCTSQATMLTGLLPRDHGIVGNGWFFRDLNEVLFWRQSHRLLDGPRMWAGLEAETAVLFWWFNMATDAAVTITPRPAYLADGRKLPDVYATPPELARELQARHGVFPLFRFWGPAAGIESTRWIADAAIDVIARFDPRLCLVYLPHLDYDLQRFGPDHPRAAAAVAEVDREAARILDAAGSRDVLVVSEYGIEAVHTAVEPNRALRRAGLLAVQENAAGEQLDFHRSRAFAVCDHQLAHVYAKSTRDADAAREVLGALDGVEILDKREHALDHARSGELVLLAKPGHWFAYPYWLDDARAPDFARTVDIHRKPGYDPCELFLDASKPRLAWTLFKRKLGFRTPLQVVPLDPSLVRGSHGRPPSTPADGPLLLGDTPEPRHMREVFHAVAYRLGVTPTKA